MQRRTTLIALAALAYVAPSLAAGSAVADERPARQVGLHRRDGWLGVSVGLRDLFGKDEAARLRSGFVVRVVIRAELYRDGFAKPVAHQDRYSEIVYDLWDERFRVQVVDRTGAKNHEVGSAEDAIELGTALQRFEVAELGALDARATYHLRLRADLNPLSDALLQDVRRWLVRTPGRSGTGDSVFGSFVSFFVNPRIEESERQISFWSQGFAGAGS